MRKDNKLLKILKLVLNQIAEIYLYFLAFYVVSLVLSFFFERWKLFFNWPVFHFSAVLFGILSLLSEKGREFIKIKRLTKEDCIKIGVMIIISAYALHKEMEPINFLVLAYALVSVLWVLESRIAAGIALLFLASSPVLLIFKKEPLAETMAIYAFYFLVICVLTQIREYLRDKKNLSTG